MELKKEGWKFRDKGRILMDEESKLWEEGGKLRDEGRKLWEEGCKLRDEGMKLWDEGNKLCDEGNKLWEEAVERYYGKDVTIKWRKWHEDNEPTCHVGSDVYI